MAATDRRLIGNKLVLAGALVYFGEWIGIAVAPSLPTDRLGADPAATMADYGHQPGHTGFLAGWLAVVLLGRIAFCVGLRDTVREHAAARRLADVAVSVMAVSVMVEIVDYGLVATASWLVDNGAPGAGVIAFDAAGTTLFPLIIAPAGVAVLLCAAAMAISGLYPRRLAWPGIAVGALLALGGIEEAAALGSSGLVHDIGYLPIPLLWLWLLLTGITVYRARQRAGHTAGSVVSPAVEANT